MAIETHNIEFKETWRDEYQKWICGFANAQGGRLYIGIDDKGVVCGVSGVKKLLEDIPNKVRDMMGILVDVNLKDKNGKQYIEIITDAYPYPISYRGKYYQRSGATNQEIKGGALDRFLLRKQGKTWDGVPLPYLKAEDLDNATFDLFRKYAKRSGRMDNSDLQEGNRELLEKLRLFDGAYLKRASALLFHSDPEQYVSGSYIKIGYFRGDMDLVYQDEVHGNLINQVAKVMDLICTKYLKAIISYEGIQRIETLPVPREALREAILNACINKDYSDPTPIQIRVSDNSLEIVNGGFLPENWTIETLLGSHRSQPYNPDIANTFFRAGEIEAWGRGIARIVAACKIDGFSIPEFKYDASGVWTIFRFSYPNDLSVVKSNSNVLKNSVETTQKTTQKTDIRLSELQLAILSYLSKNRAASRKEISDNISNITENGIKYHIAKLQKLGLLRRVGSKKGGYWEILK